MNSAPPGTKKTALCRYFISTGSCVYGDECQFLHQNPGVGFQKPFTNGPHPPTENQGMSDIMGNNGDQYFNATFGGDGVSVNEFQPFSRPMSRNQQALIAHLTQEGKLAASGPPRFDMPPGQMEGPVPGPQMNNGRPGYPRMDEPPGQQFGPRMDGPGPGVPGPGVPGPRMEHGMVNDFAALNLSVPGGFKQGPNPVANEFVPKSATLTHSSSSPNFSTLEGPGGMPPNTSTGPAPNNLMMNNHQMGHMENAMVAGQMGMPPGGPMMNHQGINQLSTAPPPHLINTGVAFSNASPNHSPHLSPTSSPLTMRRTASPIAPLKTSSTPKKSTNATIQENVGGTTYFYSPDDFTPHGEGFTLPNFSMFPSLPPHIAHMQVKKNMPQFCMPDELKMDILNRNALIMAHLDLTHATDIPTEVDTYRNLFPLEPQSTGHMQKSNRFSYPTTCYKALNTKDGMTYCLRRIHGFRLSNTKVMAVIDMWKKMYHPNIVQLKEVFTTKAFGDNSMVFVYDYHPGAETLMSHHFSPSAINGYTNPYNMDGSSRSFNAGGGKNASGPRQHAGLLPESLIWAYVVQLSSALRAIHAAGLSYRTMDPSKILIYSKSRLRLNCVGILDVLTFESNQTNPLAAIQHYQQEDLVYLGKVVLSLACNSLMAIQRDNFTSSMELIARNYSADLKNFFLYLLTNQSRARSINDIMPMIGARFYTQLDSAQLRSDVIENELAKEVENSRIFRLLCKLGAVNERPEYNLDPQWSETGDRYMLKLFRDYLFHQIDENGAPWIDMAHIAQSLNKLDNGVPEKICLMSRDELTVLVVSYAELKQNFERAFGEILSAIHQSGL